MTRPHAPRASLHGGTPNVSPVCHRNLTPSPAGSPPPGIVQRKWVWLLVFSPLWGPLFVNFGLGEQCAAAALAPVLAASLMSRPLLAVHALCACHTQGFPQTLNARPRRQPDLGPGTGAGQLRGLCAGRGSALSRPRHGSAIATAAGRRRVTTHVYVEGLPRAIIRRVRGGAWLPACYIRQDGWSHGTCDVVGCARA